MHPEIQNKAPAPADSPKFGRLLIVLAGVVLVIVALTFASVAYYS
jgi:hypothetical protein